MSSLNCDVFIKFNRHEYMENDYVKKKKVKRNTGVAKDENFKTALQALLKNPPSLFCTSFLGLRASMRLRQMGSVAMQPFPLLSLISPGYCRPSPHR